MGGLLDAATPGAEIVAALSEAGCVVSVDTMRAGVAEAAIGAGAASIASDR